MVSIKHVFMRTSTRSEKQVSLRIQFCVVAGVTAAKQYTSKMSTNRKLMESITDKMSKHVELFNKTETECLVREFHVLLREQSGHGKVVPGLDRGKFRSVLHHAFNITDDMIMDGVFRTFDKDNDGFLSVKEWLAGLSVFLRGTLDAKIKYCFTVYDLNGDGYISREEMFHLLKNSLARQPNEEDPDEGIKDLVEITLKKMDHDHDGKLSLMDYVTAVKEENLLLEAFGLCLPDLTAIYTFQERVFKDVEEL